MDNKTRIVVERGYFHTGNSGITISMVEEHGLNETTGDDQYEHQLEIRHGAFGADSSFRTAIAGPAMCQYYIDAMTRLRDRMVENEKYRIPYPFERYRHGDVQTEHGHDQEETNETYRIVDVANGLTRKEVWSPEIVTSEYGSEKRLLGHNFIDHHGTISHFVPFEGSKKRVREGSIGRYHAADIGKPVSEIRAWQFGRIDKN